MNRLCQRTSDTTLAGKRILVTGCGYKPLQKTFYDIVTNETTHDSIMVEGQEMKLNIGAATAGVLALHGATVHMVSSTEDKLANIRKSLEILVGSDLIEYAVVDLLHEHQVKTWVESLPSDKPIYWVHSVGLGAASYNIANDNPYLPLEQIDVEMIKAETSTVVEATHLVMKELLPKLRQQQESRIAIISSMSAIRGYSFGGTHCTAKGAIDRYANAVMLALYKQNIFVTTIRPGGIDTGLYDTSAAQEAIKVVSDEYAGQYRHHFTLAPPTAVGDAIAYILTTPAHIPSVNLVAKGQFPHEGS